MTAFATDFFTFQDETWRQLLKSTDFTGAAIPAEFANSPFSTQYWGTEYSPGYVVTYALSDKRLIIQDFHITGVVFTGQLAHADFKQWRVQGPREIWDSAERWDHFANLPAINGKRPIPEHITYRNQQTGDVRAEIVRYDKYTDLDLPIDFTGGMLIGKNGGHSGFPLPNRYQQVLELSFEEGQLMETTDQSDLVQRLIHWKGNERDVMFAALRRTQAELPHFQHVYTGFG